MYVPRCWCPCFCLENIFNQVVNNVNLNKIKTVHIYHEVLRTVVWLQICSNLGPNSQNDKTFILSPYLEQELPGYIYIWQAAPLPTTLHSIVAQCTIELIKSILRIRQMRDSCPHLMWPCGDWSSIFSYRFWLYTYEKGKCNKAEVAIHSLKNILMHSSFYLCDVITVL